MTGRVDGRGIGYAVGAYVIWGFFPAFWPMLDPAGPVEALAHRILWTVVLMAVVLTLIHGWSSLRLLSTRGWWMVTAAAVFIAVNWGTFIYGVAVDQVVEVALGFYINPLVSVLLGVVVLRERLGAMTWVALAVATAAVVVISFGNGRVPVIALVLAASFGLYALLKKTVPLSSTASLTAEGLVLGPLAVGFLVWLEVSGDGTLTGHGVGHVLWLVAAGPVTAVPLLLFGAAARRIPLSIIGVLQYLTPTLHFAWGVLVLGEAMPTMRWIGFGLIWVALVMFSADLLRQNRRERAITYDEPIRAAEAH